MNLHELEPIAYPLPPPLDQPLAHPTSLRCGAGAFQLQRVQLQAGSRAGVELLIVDSGQVRAAICPTRGMGLWRAHIAGIDCGWNSPVPGPIHPSLVPIDEPRGIGWLDGFDELLVRCGLRSFGAPEFDSAGRVAWPVHGRIANIPAQSVQIGVDDEQAQLHVLAVVHEVRFLQYNLQLHAHYSFSLNQPTIEIHDRVINAGGTAVSMQLLYHINVGQPLIGAGARLHLAAPNLVARDAVAVAGLPTWNEYQGPTAGFAEQVYFSQPKSNADGWATALLTSPDRSSGFATHYDTSTLPYFSQWKNSVAASDGYVTGLEPATGFPNIRSFEEQHGRTILMQSGETRSFRLRLEGISDSGRIENLAEQIAALNNSGEPQLREFDPKWCTPR